VGKIPIFHRVDHVNKAETDLGVQRSLLNVGIPLNDGKASLERTKKLGLSYYQESGGEQHTCSTHQNKKS
jgi:hypothetical protein